MSWLPTPPPPGPRGPGEQPAAGGEGAAVHLRKGYEDPLCQGWDNQRAGTPYARAGTKLPPNGGKRAGAYARKSSAGNFPSQTQVTMRPTGPFWCFYAQETKGAYLKPYSPALPRTLD